MTPDSRSPSAEEFLSEDRWLRALVRSLTREENVEDVVQSTWAAALSQLSSARVPRAWLRTIARNFVWREHRARTRRSEREAQASRPEAVPSTEETLAWIELQREVARAVQELDEPYRTAILLRYTHACSTSQIAERTQVSEENVRQRLKRGRDRLRRTLAESFRNEDSGGSSLALWWLPGVVEMKSRLSVVVVLMLVILAPVALITITKLGWSTDGSEAMESLQKPAMLVDASPVKAEATHPLQSREEIETKDALGTSKPNAITTPALGPVRGRIVDPRGLGLAGIGLGKSSALVQVVSAQGIARPTVEVRSTRDGEFELDTENTEFAFMSEAGWIPIAGTRVDDDPESRSQALVVLTPAVSRTGTVLDEEGRELEGVRIRLEGPRLLDFPHVPDRLFAPTWEPTSTDQLGNFAYRDLPADCGRLQFEKEGFESISMEIDSAGDKHLEVVLSRAKDVLVLHGSVLSPTGTPVSAALVGIGEHSTRSGARGEYRLEVPRDAITVDTNALFAAAHPWRTLKDTEVAKRLRESDSGELAFDVEFEAESLAIGGRVVDAQGEPVAGLLVYLWHEQALSDKRSAEDLAQAPDAPVLDVGPGVRAWSRTDEAGEFRLTGLSPRAYELRLYDRERKAAITIKEVMAGTEDNLFRLPEDFVIPEFSGRVVDREGQGLEGLSVRVHMGVFLSFHDYHTVSTDEMATTDEAGRFTLHDVPGIEATLVVGGEGIVTAYESLDVKRNSDLVIQVLRRCHFRILIDDEQLGAIGFQVLDKDGKRLNIDEIGPGTSTSSDWGRLHEGRTRVLSVGENAEVLALFGDVDGRWREVARRELTLAPEGVTELRF